VARNRKRAKERRARRPQPAQVARPRASSARADLEEAPNPLEHAAPDAELADAQLALGRAELAEAAEMQAEGTEVQAEAQTGAIEEQSADLDGEQSEDDLDQAPADELEEEAIAATPGRSGGGQLATIDTESGAVAEPRRVPGNRLIHFLQGSWHELQRVQWPDRRQVMQATGVVIGFVLIAGVFLGVADALAGKLMNFILK
jgi:preprotein translocase subunit SecE